MENYKEKYEQSLENIKKIKDANKNNKALVDFIEYKYPELKESEDEKMKNFISNELACLRATDERGSDRFKELTNAIAWLEKQEKIVEEYEDKLNRISCESFDKGYKAALEKQGEQNTTNKVETKFHKRDWITIDNPCQIISIDRNYIVQYCDDEKTREISKKFCEFYFHLWTIRDAKNGDILTLNDEYFLFKDQKSSITEVYISHCFVDSAGTFRKGGEFLQTERGVKIYPATKNNVTFCSEK